jgi:Ca2+-binding RTX toxin-like protein
MVRILDTNPLNPNDTLDLFSFGLGADTVVGLTGSDFITSDTVGGSLIFGNQENDSLTSSTSGDSVYGGQDDDFLVSKGGGSVFFGDLGQDRYETRGSLGRDTVYGGTSNEAENRVEDGEDIFNFGNGLGGNLAFGNGGDDFISGSGLGSDTLYGGIGDDTIQVIEVAGDAGTGGGAFVPDTVEGLAFVPPLLFGGAAGAGATAGLGVGVVLDSGVPIPRNPGRNYLSGDKGNDVIFGIGDRDSLFGGEGNDSLFMLSTDATTELGLSTDGENTLVGARRALAGFPRNNWLNGGTGNDYIHSYGGERGRQTMIGGEGDDSLFNRGNQVLVFGNTGADYLETTGFSRSTLYGGQDNDTVISGFSLDPASFPGGVTTGGGTNLLYGDKGNDTMLSTGDRDTLIGGNIEDNDTIAGNNLDYLSLGGNTSIGFGNQGNDTLIGVGELVTLYGGQDNDYITASGANSYLSGDKGNDSISSSGATSTLVGGEGDDTLLTTAADNTLIGGEGNDSLYARDGGGNNLLMVTSGNNVLVAGSKTDTLMGGTGNDLLVGSEDGDTLRADSPGLDTLEGFYGADSLIGTVGAADVFVFGSIADALSGVTVNPDSTIGAGATAAPDTITTFESGRDKIYLNLTGFGLDPEAIAGLRTNIDFFSVDTTTTYAGSFQNVLTGTAPSAIIFDAQQSGGYLLWDANGADPTDRATATTNDLITIAVISTGAITRNDIFLF